MHTCARSTSHVSTIAHAKLNQAVVMQCVCAYADGDQRLAYLKAVLPICSSEHTTAALPSSAD